MEKRGKFLILVVIFLLILPYIYAPPPPPPSSPGSPDSSGSNATTQTCNNNIKNQDETDVDCGGRCNKCENLKLCNTNNDCLSDYCSSQKRCIAPSCNDDVKNGNEQGIDCGGDCSLCITQPSVQNQFEKKYTEEDVKKIIEQFSPPKPKILTNLLIFLGTFIVSVVVSFIVFTNIQKKKTTIPSTPRTNIPTKQQAYQNIPIQKGFQNYQINPFLNQLRHYIIYYSQHGFNEDQIRQALFRQNIPLQRIDEAFQSLRRW